MRYFFAVVLLLSMGVGTGHADVLRFYVAPAELGGRDNVNDGLSIATPLATLQNVQDKLRERRLCGVGLSNPIEVHILPATYVGNPISWDCFTGGSITFTSLNFSSVRPVFVGGGAACAGQVQSETCPHTWFSAEDRNGTQGQLNFLYIKVQDYSQAMGFKRVGSNYLYGMYFYRIGSSYGPLGCRNSDCTSTSEPTSAVAFQKNSSNNRVANSHFIHVENRSNGSRLHALYISDYSSANVIERNRFEWVSGTPIKVRNASSFNRASANRFNRTGDGGFFSDSFNPIDECPGWGNEFSQNQLYQDYDGGPQKKICLEDKPTIEVLGRCGWFQNPYARVKCVGNVQY